MCNSQNFFLMAKDNMHANIFQYIFLKEKY